MKKARVVLPIIRGLLIFALFSASCAPAPGLNQKVDSIARPHRFSIAGWEIKTLLNDVRENNKKNEQPEINKETAEDYFSIVERIRYLEWEVLAANSGFREGDPAALGNELSRLKEQRAALTSDTESILERQIADVLLEQGIYNPLEKYLRLKTAFPPVRFKLETPPFLLVVSPRERIENIKDVLLRQDMDLTDMESIEAGVEKLGVSAIVLPLGGLAATYPTFVTNEADIRFTIDAATEEWLHHYLFFKPLGFRYFLDTIGIRPDYEIATINETVAGMVSKEIGSIVYDKHYRKGNEANTQGEQPSTADFDFNREMRETRKTVDAHLARREVEQAEQFMEAKREFLASKGYYIRKLNQAYFAFYGTYGDSPISISPIGTEMKELRAKIPSLKEFLDTVSVMTNREDLQKAL